MKEIITTRNAPSGAGLYSQAVLTENLIFLSGQGSVDSKTNKVIDGNIIEQTEVTLTNINNILESAGSGLNKVVKVNVYLANINDFDEFNFVYKKYFEKSLPARTTIGCFLNGIKVEIDVIATK